MFGIDLLNSSPFTKSHDEDFVDALINRITPFIVWSFAWASFSQNPMVCNGEPEWSDSLVQYARDTCFYQGTYIVPMDQPYSQPISYGHQKLNYYQFIPFIFLLMGAVSKAPQVIWRFITPGSYFDAYCKQAVTTVQKTCKESAILRFTIDLEHSIANKAFTLRHFWVCYMIKKLLNSFVIVILMKMLSYFIAENPHDHFGIAQLGSLLFGQINNTTNFPIKTACEFDVKELYLNGNTMYSRKVTDCFLPLNESVQKWYIFLWFWLASMFILNSLNLCLWLRAFLPCNIKAFLQEKLEIADAFKPSDTIGFQEYWITKFYEALPLDGVFLLTMIDTNAKPIVAQIIKELFETQQENDSIC